MRLKIKRNSEAHNRYLYISQTLPNLVSSYTVVIGNPDANWEVSFDEKLDTVATAYPITDPQILKQLECIGRDDLKIAVNNCLLYGGSTVGLRRNLVAMIETFSGNTRAARRTYSYKSWRSLVVELLKIS
jgi:hypothetical protein